LTLSDLQKILRKYIRIKNKTAVEFLAEIVGTFFLVCFGLASVAQFKLQKQADKHAYSFISVNFAFGFGLTCGAVMIGKISGINKFDFYTVILIRLS
jgi:glycerol uptake facilitator-like aquaporin